MTDEKEWRRFMDQKWAEYYRDRDLFNKRYGSDDLRAYQSALSNVQDKPEVKEIKKSSSHAPIKKPQRPIAKGQRPMPAAASRTKHEFDIPAAGLRRRELGKKVNPTESELREYRDLSNKIEDALDKRQRKLNDDASKA